MVNDDYKFNSLSTNKNMSPCDLNNSKGIKKDKLENQVKNMAILIRNIKMDKQKKDL